MVLALSGWAVEDTACDPVHATAHLDGGRVRLEPSPAPAGPPRSLLVPGLVNLHEHLRAMMPTGRRSEGAPLREVITAASRVQEVATAQDYEVLTALGSARQVRAGVTSVVDHVYPLHRPDLLAGAVRGHQRVGLRASVALGVITEGYEPIRAGLEEVVALAARAADDLLPREQLFLAPVSLRQTSVEAYSGAAVAADREGLRLYTHIAETAEEVDRCVAEHGVRPVELLHRVGFLRPGTVLVHCLHLTDAEIELLAATGTQVAYCPTNHLRFAKGFARVVDLLEAGVLVGLGVDGMESVLHEMRQAVYAQGQAQQDTAALGSDAAFAMATTQGARALDVPGVSGRISDAPDLVRLDTSRSATQPLVDPVWTLVHRAGPQDVTDVVIDGRTVVRDRTLVTIDEDALVDQATLHTRRLAERAGSLVTDDWKLHPTALAPAGHD
ncbi:amidohydrolase family protein [Georgenia sp. H159]|uniref:amidohydrolase family protein n=1 Tax=Georgenia sp. H159 TaxID=3076115 RepID=UPI002D793258|nr:amidohydrolase family protein [Georgenia sp. H159]